jgi:hypothetical protein
MSSNSAIAAAPRPHWPQRHRTARVVSQGRRCRCHLAPAVQWDQRDTHPQEQAVLLPPGADSASTRMQPLTASTWPRAATPARSCFGGLIRSLPDSLPRVVARYRPASKCFFRADAGTTSPTGRSITSPCPSSQRYAFVIGVDTHAATHSLALVTAGTGAVVDRAVLPNTPPGLDSARDWITRRIDGRPRHWSSSKVSVPTAPGWRGEDVVDHGVFAGKPPECSQRAHVDAPVRQVQIVTHVDALHASPHDMVGQRWRPCRWRSDRPNRTSRFSTPSRPARAPSTADREASVTIPTHPPLWRSLLASCPPQRASQSTPRSSATNCPERFIGIPPAENEKVVMATSHLQPRRRTR